MVEYTNTGESSLDIYVVRDLPASLSILIYAAYMGHWSLVQ